MGVLCQARCWTMGSQCVGPRWPSRSSPGLTDKRVFTTQCHPHCDGLRQGQESSKGPPSSPGCQEEGASEPRCEGWPDRVCVLTLSPSPPREVCKPCSLQCGPHGSSNRATWELSGNAELWPHPDSPHQNQYFNKLPWESTFMLEKCWCGCFRRT